MEDFNASLDDERASCLVHSACRQIGKYFFGRQAYKFKPRVPSAGVESLLGKIKICAVGRSHR